MKIGFDAKRAVQNFTGLGNYSRFVINNLIKLYPENEYTLFCPKPIDNNFTNLHISDSTHIVGKNGFYPFWRTFGITQELKKSDLNIFHGLSNELPINIHSTKVKSIVTIHDLIFLKYPQFYPLIDRHIYNAKAQYACKHADKIIAISECTKRDIIKYYRINPSKIEVVYQGCFSDFAQSVANDKKLNLLQKYSLPQQYILTVGSIEDRKNILLIIKALKHVPNIHFVAIGKQQPYAQKIKEYIANTDLEHRVHLLSGIPFGDLPGLVQASKIFIYPSLYEGFGIPIIEAISAGVPVIAAKGSCLEEAGGSDSLYVDPFDENDMADKINYLLANEIICNHMITKGKEYIKRFSEEKCTSDLMKIYEDLI